jgi:O-antigen ligase
VRDKITNSLKALGFWLFPEKDFLVASLLVFFAGSFVVSPQTLWSMVFYAGFVPATFYAFCHGARPDWRQPGFIIAGLMILWSALTLLWGENPGNGRVMKYGCGALSTALYISGLSIALGRNAMLMQRIGTVFIFMGAANALYSILAYLISHNPDGRLGGWAETRHPILGALVMSMSFIFALDRMLREDKPRFHKTLAGVVFVCLTFIILTQSRGPYGATTLSTFVLLASAPWGKKIKIIKIFGLLFLCLAGVMLAFYAASPEVLVEKISQRGMSHRLDIWDYTLGRIAEHPWIGHGPAAYLGMDGFSFPHDLYLSTLFYNGVIGLAFMLVLLGYLILWLLRQWGRNDQAPLLLALLINALVGGLTDLGQLTPGPAPLWLILWLPLSLVFAQMAKRPQRRV